MEQERNSIQRKMEQDRNEMQKRMDEQKILMQMEIDKQKNAFNEEMGKHKKLIDKIKDYDITIRKPMTTLIKESLSLQQVYNEPHLYEEPLKDILSYLNEEYCGNLPISLMTLGMRDLKI